MDDRKLFPSSPIGAVYEAIIRPKASRTTRQPPPSPLLLSNTPPGSPTVATPRRAISFIRASTTTTTTSRTSDRMLPIDTPTSPGRTSRHDKRASTQTTTPSHRDKRASTQTTTTPTQHSHPVQPSHLAPAPRDGEAALASLSPLSPHSANRPHNALSSDEYDSELDDKSPGGRSSLLSRVRKENRVRKRDRVKMVGHHLHSAFKTWFKDTDSDGTPLLPYPLSKKYTITDKVLGQGSFALVKLVIEKSTGENKALKIIAKRPLKDNNEKMLKEEIAILGKVEHPHIIKMWDMYETKEGVYIVTDLCRGGELFDRLVEKVHYDELDARHITRQMFEGIDYLHEHDIIHRDLKPENILLREKQEPSEIVISDFGLSKFIPDDGHLLMTACGSPQYVAPEVLLGKGYDAAVDIWSGGVIAYCLLAGYTPFYGEDQPTLFQQILGMKVEFEPEYWSDVSDTAKDFIMHCLCPREKRFTAKQALKHPYLADLPPLDGKESHRGCSLKQSALRHQSTKSKFNRVVTAVEASNYLQRLHDLRKTHSSDIHPERLQSLLRLAMHISNSSTWSDEETFKDTKRSSSTGTVKHHDELHGSKKDGKGGIKDSGMSLDL